MVKTDVAHGQGHKPSSDHQRSDRPAGDLKWIPLLLLPSWRGTKGDIIAARIEVPILVVMIYGIVEFIRLGWSQDYYFYTYAPVLGGVAASVGLFTYFFLVSVERKKSRKNLLAMAR